MTHDFAQLIRSADGMTWLGTCSCAWMSDACDGPGTAMAAWQRHRSKETG